VTRAQLRLWCERHFGKDRNPAAEALGLTLAQLRERLYRDGVMEKDRQTAILAELYDRTAWQQDAIINLKRQISDLEDELFEVRSNIPIVD
jgi:hypothetical protein